MSEKKQQIKPKEGPVEANGVVLEAVRGKFRVKLNDSDHIILAQIAGSLRMNNIRIVPGDKVRLEISTYDLTRGRIVYRER